MGSHKLAGGILVAGAVAVALVVATSVAGHEGSRRSEVAGARHVPEPAYSRERVTVSIGLLESLMAADVEANQPYLARVRTRRGDAAAAAAEAAVRAPYLRRIERMKSAGLSEEAQEMTLITVNGAFRFSAMSFDGGINEKDPVSLLLYGDTSIDDVYEGMVRDGQQGRSYQDENGQMDSSAMRECRSQTQWVLMGNDGEELTWRRSERGLMRLGEKCTEGLRDHVRFYGDIYNREFGRWLVGTPHREAWVPGAGHRIDSWTSARDAIRDFWLGAAPLQTRFAGNPAVRGWELDDWGNAGAPQGVPFDGYGLSIALGSPAVSDEAIPGEAKGR